MLEWSKIDSWQKFQSLVNAMFELEMHSTDFKPSDPMKGADGGQDAVSKEGCYLDKAGKFLVQSKRKNLDAQPKQAFDSLKEELLEKEFNNFKKHSADWLFYCVNVSIGCDYQVALENFASKNGVNLIVFDRPKLEGIISSYPYLRKFWFDEVQNLSIETPAEYFSRYESCLGDVSELICADRYEMLRNTFSDFIVSDDIDFKFMGIFAPGGVGKSHFLRNLIFNNIKNYNCEFYFLKDLEKNISEIFEKELNHSKDYLLIVDDMDKWDQTNLKALLKQVYYSKSVKLLFSSRVVNSSLFNDLLCKLGITKPILIEIPEWSQGDLLEVLHSFTGKSDIEDQISIVTKFNKPFYLRLVADAINKVTRLSTDNINHFITTKEKNLFISVVEGVVGSSPVFDYDAVLFELSLLLPSSNISELFRVFMFYFNKNEEESRGIVESLVKDGFLRYIGRSYRFSPDMKGDLFIVSGFELVDDDKLKELIAKWFDNSPDNVVKNLYYSIAYESKARSEISDCLSRLASDIAGSFNLHNISGLSGILVKVEYLAHIFPDVGIKVVRNGLNFVEAGKLDRSAWNSDKFAPIIKILMRRSENDKALIEFLIKMNSLRLDGFYDNQKAVSLLRHFVSPAYYNIKAISSRMDILLQLEDNKDNLILFKAVFTELLMGGYEHTRSHDHSFTIGAIPFNISDEGLALRNKCLEYIKDKWLLSGKNDFINAALDVISDFGRVNLGGANLDSGRYERIDQEKEFFIDVFLSHCFISSNFSVLTRIERMLIRWWCNKYSFEEKIVTFLLNKIPVDLEYVLYKYLARGFLCILKPFKDYYQLCPAEVDRWSWLLETVEANRYRWDEAKYKAIVEQLESKFATAEAKVSLFSRLSKLVDIPMDNVWYLWVSVAISDFYDIFCDQTLWDTLPVAIRKISFSKLAVKHDDVKAKYIDYFHTCLPEPDMDEMHLFFMFLKDDVEEKKKIYDILSAKSSHTLISSAIFQVKAEEFSIKHKFLKDYLLRLYNLEDSQAEDNVAHMLIIFKDNTSCLIDKEVNDLVVEKLLKTPVWGDNVIEIFKYLKLSKELLWGLLRSRKQDDLSSDEKVPYRFLSSIKKIFNNDNYSFVFNNMVKLDFHIWPNPFSELVNMIDSNGNLFIVALLDDIALDSNMLCKTLYNFDLTETTLNVWVKYISILAEKVKLGELRENELSSVLYTKTTPSGGYSSSPGERPPALVAIQGLYSKLGDSVGDVFVTSIFKKCIQYVESTINDSMERDRVYHLDR
ncbi:MAG: hypothetical protein KAJ14_03430 [Candidatus Omnitrophica bacterium]|nr:hypothetical protein [Candidatus Omnitrophota bacterium]